MNHPKNNLAKATVRGTFWVYITKYSGKALYFISTIILARLLIKEDFGLAGYAILVIGFLQFPDFGMGAALVYYDKDPKRINTAFWLALGMGLLLFAVMWLSAPFVGMFFNEPRSIPLTRALALTFPLNSLSNIQSGLLTKELAFKRKSVPEFVRGLSKGVVAISLAWLGLGPWSLVWGQIIGTAAATVTFWIISPWRPSFSYTPSLARPLLSYGSQMISINTLGVLLVNIDYIFIGRFLGAAALGVYTVAFRIPELLIKNFADIIGNVLFPVYTKIRDDANALTYAFLNSTRFVAVITVPIGLGLALISEPFVLMVFGEKWAEAIPIMSAISIYTLLRSLYYFSGSVYKAQGHPELLVKLNLIQLILSIPLFWGVTVYYGTLIAVAWTQVLAAFIFGIIQFVVASRMLNTSFASIMEALYPAFIGGLFMIPVVLGTLYLLTNTPLLVQLVISVCTGMLSYIATLWWIERDLVTVGIQTLRTTFARGT